MIFRSQNHYQAFLIAMIIYHFSQFSCSSIFFQACCLSLHVYCVPLMFKNCAWFISLLVHFHFDGWFLLDDFFTYSFTGNCHGRNLSWRIFSRRRAKTRVAFQCRWKSFNGGLNTIRSCHRPKSIRQLRHHRRNF